jgi:hypothetical protein
MHVLTGVSKFRAGNEKQKKSGSGPGPPGEYVHERHSRRVIYVEEMPVQIGYVVN